MKNLQFKNGTEEINKYVEWHIFKKGYLEPARDYF